MINLQCEDNQDSLFEITKIPFFVKRLQSYHDQAQRLL